MSLDNVKTKVLEAAKAEAEKLLEEATRRAECMLNDSRAANDRAGQEATRDARLRLEREQIRELERIQHDNRLQILSAKNKAVDEVFKRVGDKLSSLSDNDYLELVDKWLGALPANVGGVLRVNPKDEAKFTAGLDIINRSRSGDGVFTKVVADPKVPDGAIVDVPDYNIDCTVARRLSELRESSVGELAKVLFGA